MVWVCNYHVDFPNDSSDVTCLLCRRPGASGAEGVDASFAWWAVSTGNQISSRLLSARWGGGMHIVVQGGVGQVLHPAPPCWRCLRPAKPHL